MKKKYILTKTEPREFTTDTLVLFVCEDRGSLEELILYNWENTEYEVFNYLLQTTNEVNAMKTAKSVAESFAEKFQINIVYEIDP